MPLGALEEIYNFRWCAPDLASAGQPLAAEFPCRLFHHCAANMRVSTFLALYRILALGWPRAAALAEMAAIWQPNAQWQAFIEQQLA